MSEEEYYIKILQIITPILEQKDITLTELAKKAQGVTPIELSRIVGSKLDNIAKSKPYSEKKFSYPEPNPIDIDWRFTAETSKEIGDLLEKKSKNIGCLGVPTIFKQLIKQYKSKLFDINPFLPDYFPSYREDIVLIDLDSEKIDSEKIEGYDFDIIVMDPPWYLNSYINWFKQAINNLKSGGLIYTTSIPPLVRPKAILEWDKIMREFDKCLINEETDFEVSYETPFFEHETFDSLGFGYVGNWRKTNLNCFRLVNKQKFEIIGIEKNDWNRFRFGNKIVSLKVSDDNSKIFAKPPYSDGSYTLKSVSNRESIRNQVNFITSRNKALIIHGTKKVDSFLRKLSQTLDFNESIDATYTQEEIQSLKIIHSLIGI